MANAERPRTQMRGKKTMVAAALAASLATGYEGVKLVAYKDPVGIPTICAGRTSNVKMGDKATREQCVAWLGEEMMQSIETVERCHPKIDFTVNQLAAYGDIVYNVGPRPVCDTKASTMARLLAAGRVVEACREFPKWDKARVAGVLVSLPGLTKRRQANMQLCLRHGDGA